MANLGQKIVITPLNLWPRKISKVTVYKCTRLSLMIIKKVQVQE